MIFLHYVDHYYYGGVDKEIFLLAYWLILSGTDDWMHIVWKAMAMNHKMGLIEFYN